MKKFKFLFVTVILTCFAGITQINAQAQIVRGVNSPEDGLKIVHYEVDGVTYFAGAASEYKFVITPSGILNWVFQGEIYEVYDPETGEVMEDIPLPKKAFSYIDPGLNDEKVTVTPKGKVHVIAQIKF